MGKEGADAGEMADYIFGSKHRERVGFFARQDNKAALRYVCQKPTGWRQTRSESSSSFVDVQRKKGVVVSPNFYI